MCMAQTFTNSTNALTSLQGQSRQIARYYKVHSGCRYWGLLRCPFKKRRLSHVWRTCVQHAKANFKGLLNTSWYRCSMPGLLKEATSRMSSSNNFFNVAFGSGILCNQNVDLCVLALFILLSAFSAPAKAGIPPWALPIESSALTYHRKVRASAFLFNAARHTSVLGLHWLRSLPPKDARFSLMPWRLQEAEQ